MNLAYKVLKSHLKEGELKSGEEICIQIDQTLTQDSTGTMAYLQLEAMGIEHVQVEKAVAYIDHNMLQTGFENMDDHEFIRSVAKKHGIVFSKPGNGVCHQLQLENFSKPGKTIVGSDSHTPTCGAMGMIAIGAGGLDVAKAMATGKYYLQCPSVIQVHLTGIKAPWVSAKDIILKILQVLSVKGGVNKIVEYTGDGLASLSLTDRATICNMGAELGATTSIFPTDERTLEYLVQQGREEDYVEMKADDDAYYDERLDIDMSTLEPMVAKPHSPDAVVSVKELEGMHIHQVVIGSCTNSSFADMMKAAKILKGRKVAKHVSLVIAPGSSSILAMLAQNGALADMIQAGARILECGCGPCIGMGQAPLSKGISLRTINRNFKGRSGTNDANVYLVSPEIAALSAIKGYLSCEFEDDMYLKQVPSTPFIKNANFFINDYDPTTKVYMGPNIKPVPLGSALENEISGKMVLKVGDNISTDHIVPSDSKLLPYRSNVPHLAKFSFCKVDDKFYDRAIKNNGGFIVGGDNYGQGSSREHAALVPNYLKIKAIFALSFARIHRSNLINNGILPLVIDKNGYDFFNEYDEYKLLDVQTAVDEGKDIVVKNMNTNETIQVKLTLSPREKVMIKYGGLLNAIKELGENLMKAVLIPGDGIGPEIAKSVEDITQAMNLDIEWIKYNAGAEYAFKTKEVFEPGLIDAIKEYKWALKGPTATPIGTGFRSVNVALRQKFATYANVRPILSLKGINSKYENIDLVMIRENTEDLYKGIEYMVSEDVAHGVKLITRQASEKICRYAFEYAKMNSRHKVTAIHKANIMKLTDGLFLEAFRKVGEDYPDIDKQEVIIDNMCMQLVLRPETFDVLVAPNLYGDIVSDLCAGLVGGLGFAPSANIGDEYRIYEAVHGSAPDIAGKNIANPSALLLAFALMLDDLGKTNEASQLRKALAKVVEEGKTVTPDIGGHATTFEFTQAIIEKF